MGTSLERSISSTSAKLGNEFERQIIKTESIGQGDLIVLFVERETSQFAGFMNPLVKCSMNANKIKDFSEEEFNVNSDTYFFLRESHEDNRKKPVGVTARNGTMYNRVGIVSDPVEKYTDDGICSIKTEKKIEMHVLIFCQNPAKRSRQRIHL